MTRYLKQAQALNSPFFPTVSHFLPRCIRDLVGLLGLSLLDLIQASLNMADNRVWMLGRLAHVIAMFRALAAVDAAWLLLAACHSTAQSQSSGLAVSGDLDCVIKLAMLVLD